MNDKNVQLRFLNFRIFIVEISSARFFDELVLIINEELLSRSFNVSIGTISEWISDIKSAYQGSRDSFIYKMSYLGFTQQEISDLVGDVGQGRVSQIINNFTDEKINEIQDLYYNQKKNFENIASLYVIYYLMSDE